MKKILTRLLILLLLLSCLQQAFAGTHGRKEFGLWPLFSYKAEEGEKKLEIIPPLFEKEVKKEGCSYILRPIGNYRLDNTTHTSNVQILWPLLESKNYNDGIYFQLLPLLFHSRMNITTEEDKQENSIVLFPIYFNRRSFSQPDDFACFPIAGKLHNTWGSDEISFLFWPLYGYSRKGDFCSQAILWPIIAFYTHKEQFIGMRLFPLFGYINHPGLLKKHFLFWPFFQHQVSFDGDKKRETAFIIFPLWGHLNTVNEETHFILFPFFQTRRDKRNQYTKRYFPWPFFFHISGENIRGGGFWPIWGETVEQDKYNHYFLWPLVTFRKEHSSTRETVSQNYLLFYKQTTFDPNEKTLIYQKEFLWPLYTLRRNNDASSLQLFDLLPFWESEGMRLNYSPFWTVFVKEQTKNYSRIRLLWGFYESEVDHKRQFSSRSLLHGLLGFKQEKETTIWQFLYLFRLHRSQSG